MSMAEGNVFAIPARLTDKSYERATEQLGRASKKNKLFMEETNWVGHTIPKSVMFHDKLEG